LSEIFGPDPQGKAEEISKNDAVIIFKHALLKLWPKKFEEGRKRLEVAATLFKIVYLDHQAEPSEGELAKLVGWSSNSRANINRIKHNLAEIKIVDKDTLRFRLSFPMELWGLLWLRINEDIRTVNRFGSALKDSPTGELNVINDFGAMFKALAEVLATTQTDDEVFLVLKEGRNWADPQHGAIMCRILEHWVKKRKLRLRVLASPLLDQKLERFFSRIGGTVIKDEAFGRQELRSLAVPGWVLEVETPDPPNQFPIRGLWRSDPFGFHMKLISETYERLASKPDSRVRVRRSHRLVSH
jgi:hypothetical protein